MDGRSLAKGKFFGRCSCVTAVHASCSTSKDVFGGGEELDITVPSSPFRRRRRSASIDPRRYRIESTELLSQCISILQSIISEDCRFPLTPPRPFRPPNSLQAISLDIALLLVHMHATSHAVVSQVGFALLPAFITFKAEMYPRLLLFFESMLRGMLHEERRFRGSVKDGAVPYMILVLLIFFLLRHCI